MLQVRFWQPDDLPALRWFAVMNAWMTLPDGDRKAATVAAVAHGAEMNLVQVLSSPGGTALVAIDDQQPVGYLLIAVRPAERTNEPVGYMADIYIEPEYRRQGIAEQFHAMGEDYLKALGVKSSTLWIHAHNRLGQTSAQRRGYALSGIMMSHTLEPSEVPL